MAIPPESELGPPVPKMTALASASLLLLGTKLEDDLPSDVDKEEPVSFDWLVGMLLPNCEDDLFAEVDEKTTTCGSVERKPLPKLKYNLRVPSDSGSIFLGEPLGPPCLVVAPHCFREDRADGPMRFLTVLCPPHHLGLS